MTDDEYYADRNHELCGVFYYQYDNTLKKFEAYKPGCRILEFNISQEKYSQEDKFILIDQNYEFHMLETNERKIVAIRKSQTIQEMIDLPMIGYYQAMLRATRDRSNHKYMSIFSHDHLIVADEEGLSYLDLQNQEGDALKVNAEKVIQKIDENEYFK